MYMYLRSFCILVSSSPSKSLWPNPGALHICWSSSCLTCTVPTPGIIILLTFPVPEMPKDIGAVKLQWTLPRFHLGETNCHALQEAISVTDQSPETDHMSAISPLTL